MVQDVADVVVLRESGTIFVLEIARIVAGVATHEASHAVVCVIGVTGIAAAQFDVARVAAVVLARSSVRGLVKVSVLQLD